MLNRAHLYAPLPKDCVLNTESQYIPRPNLLPINTYD